MDSNNMNGNVNPQPQYQQAPQGAPQPQYQQAPQGAPQPQYQQAPQYQQPQYQQAPQYQQPQYQQPVYNASAPQIPNNYKPISAWGYVGYNILFCVPFIGLILIIVFSFSKENINRRNYARSILCMIFLSLAITMILTFAFGFSIMSLFG